MNWRELLHIDLGQLLRGRIEVLPHRSPRSRRSLLQEALAIPPALIRRGVLAFFLVRRRSLIQVTDLLARIVACNAPLAPALYAAMADSPHTRLLRMLQTLWQGLDQGLSLAESMRSKPRLFPRYYVDTIDAGERSGSLYPALRELSSGMDDAWRVRESFLTGAMYFAVVLTIVSSITGFLCVKVFPVFAEVLRDFSGSSRVTTLWLVRLYERCDLAVFSINEGNFHFRITLLHLYAIAFALAVWYIWRRRGPIGFLIPGIRRCVIEANLAHLAQILKHLLKAGCPLDEAIDTASGLHLLWPFPKALRRIRERVRSGQGLAQALEEEPRLFPASFRAIIALGESAGQLPETFERIGFLYRARVLRMTQTALSALFVAGITTLGCVLFTVYSYPFKMYIAIIDDLMAQM